MKPTFRTDLTCSREEQQGVVFYRIDDPKAQTSFRLYEIEYLIAKKLDGSLELPQVIEAGQQLLIEDVFGTLFDLQAANGALRITSSHPDLKLTSRTYNTAGVEGTYGQFITAAGSDDATQDGIPVNYEQIVSSLRIWRPLADSLYGLMSRHFNTQHQEF